MTLETPTKKSPPRLCALAIFGAGCAGGALIWFLSPFVVGETEPWDANAYYAAMLFITGLLTGFVCPSRWWLSPIGILVGQIAYILVTIDWKDAALLPIGLIYAAIALVLAFLGAGLSALVSRFCKRRQA